jgi:hypothetical protein
LTSTGVIDLMFIDPSKQWVRIGNSTVPTAAGRILTPANQDAATAAYGQGFAFMLMVAFFSVFLSIYWNRTGKSCLMGPIQPIWVRFVKTHLST